MKGEEEEELSKRKEQEMVIGLIEVKGFVSAKEKEEAEERESLQTRAI